MRGAGARATQDYLIYRKRHRPLKVLCVDNTTKMVLIDDSAPVGDVVTAIGKKMLLKNPEEFSLMTTTREPNSAFARVTRIFCATKFEPCQKK